MESVECATIETNSSSGENSFFPDFGLSALNNLTQLARLSQNNAAMKTPSNTEKSNGANSNIFNNLSTSNSNLPSSNTKNGKPKTIAIAPKQTNSTNLLNSPVVITLDQLKQATNVRHKIPKNDFIFLKQSQENAR